MFFDHVTRKSSVDDPSTDEVSLDLCSSRRVITVPLDHCSSRSDVMVPLDHIKKSSHDDSLVIDSSADVVFLGRDNELEVSETQFEESDTGRSAMVSLLTC